MAFIGSFVIGLVTRMPAKMVDIYGFHAVLAAPIMALLFAGCYATSTYPLCVLGAYLFKDGFSIPMMRCIAVAFVVSVLSTFGALLGQRLAR